MLPKNLRLNLKTQANTSIFKNQVLDSQAVKYFARRSNDNSFKAAVVIAVKAYSKAVRRNQLKRIVYQIIQEHPVKLSNLEIVLLVYKTIPYSEEEFVKEIYKNLNKIQEKYSHD